MRLIEILTPPDKRPLFELAMNQRTYQRIASQYGNKINVGFEFEFTIPEESGLFRNIVGEPESNAQTRLVRDMDVDDFISHFELLRKSSMIRDVEDFFEHTYTDYVSEKAEEYADDNWEEFDEEDEDEGRDQAEDYYKEHRAPDREDLFDDLKDDLIHDSNVQPYYGWTDDHKDEFYIEEHTDGYDEDEVVDQLIGQIEAELEDEGIDFDKVTADGSVTWPGIEVVTPPANLNDALQAADEITNWMANIDAEVDDTAGLHINISVENIKQLDPVKLAVFLGDEYSLRVFNRIQNRFTPSQIQKVVDQLQRNKIDFGDSFDETVQVLSELLNSRKYGSFNLEKLDDGYVEFRIAGGANYHKNYQTIEQMVYRFATAMVAAADPQAYRKEYIKKVSKLLQRGDEPRSNVGNQLPKGIAKLDKVTTANIAPSNRYETYLNQLNSNGDYILPLIDFLLVVKQTIDKANERLSFQDIQFLRKLYKQHEQKIQRDASNEQLANIYQLLRLNTQKKQMSQQATQSS